MRLPMLELEHSDTPPCGSCDLPSEPCVCGGTIHRERQWVGDDAWQPTRPNDEAIFNGRANVRRCCTKCGLDWLISEKRRKSVESREAAVRPAAGGVEMNEDIRKSIEDILAGRERPDFGASMRRMLFDHDQADDEMMLSLVSKATKKHYEALIPGFDVDVESALVDGKIVCRVLGWRRRAE